MSNGNESKTFYPDATARSGSQLGTIDCLSKSYSTAIEPVFRGETCPKHLGISEKSRLAIVDGAKKECGSKYGAP